MSPRDRDRAREKRRHEKRQAVLDLRQAEARRNHQVVGVVLAIVVVIGGLVGLSFALNKDNESTATPRPSASATPARTLPDKATAAGKTFTATVTTSLGVITMELDGTKAPQTVASFLGLARSAYWANSPCHRLTASDTVSVLQCGDPTGTGSGDPGYGFGVENTPADSNYPPGALAMARGTDPNSNGGQFFIVYKQTNLPKPGYSIFGKVTSGMDIVDRVAAAGSVPPKDGKPVKPISILKVDVAEKEA